MNANQIRQQFLDFFAGKAHAIVASSPVVPHDDPTLMFTNAGMNQFKDVFLGTGKRAYNRAADTQKCIRAGGKHNDLDDVGKDTYHHTFFEMLGNWSFGDYFKKEAIKWAWELMTEVWGIEKDRLHATYFEGDADEGLEPDDEAARLWREETDILPENVHPGNKKDNFWEMGDTGPCGPCSEIHIDLTPDKSGAHLVNAGDAQVIELWNLVFIQFNRGNDGKLTPLPAKHVDTGMGFERLCAILQGKMSNYDTDVFTPIFDAIRKRTGAPAYTGTLPDSKKEGNASPQEMIDVSYRVIADHVRCLTFALTDGALPSNEGRGYVLRRILRRAVRYGRQYFEMHEPFLCDLVAPLVAHMAGAFPELRQGPDARHPRDNVKYVADVLRDEESSFLKTIDRGINSFWLAVLASILSAGGRGGRTITASGFERGSKPDKLSGIRPPDLDKCVIQVSSEGATQPVFATSLKTISPYAIRQMCDGTPRISGEYAFELYSTYGFPIDLTEQMAEELGLGVDSGGFEKELEKARAHARANQKDLEGQSPEELIEMLRQSMDDFEGHMKKAPARNLDDPFDPLTYKRLKEGFTCDDLLKYEGFRCNAFIWSLGPRFERVGESSEFKPCDEVNIQTNRTVFYAEQGGQVSDVGTIEIIDSDHRVQCKIKVTDVLRQSFTHRDKLHESIVHIGTVVEGSASIGLCRMVVDPAHRIPTMQNHTSTHILNLALREVLGGHVQQKGSLVDPEKTRFDFSHPKPVSDEELARIEEICREQIERDLQVYAAEVEQQAARRINTLRAVFGEKYPDRVRVVSIGVPIGEVGSSDPNTLLGNPENPEWMKYSVEFCGGTHLQRSGEAERFTLVSEEGVAKGVRRVVGVSGETAKEAVATGEALMKKAQALLGSKPAGDDPKAFGEQVSALQRAVSESTVPVLVRRALQAKIADLQKRMKELDKQAEAASGDIVMARVAELLSAAKEQGGVTVVVGEVPSASADVLRGAVDWLRNKSQASAVLLASADNSKVTLIAGMSREVVDKGVKAGDLIREVAPLVGGKGGGRPDMAQGGGTEPGGIPALLEKSKAWLIAKLG